MSVEVALAADRGRSCRTIPIAVRTVICVVALLTDQVVHAGGDAYRVKVRDFARQGHLAARFTVVLVSAERPFPGGCNSLEVQARYAWWKWWWDDVAGQVSRTAQQRALDILERSASSDEAVGFGYMVEGWRAELTQPCKVVSNALVEYKDNPLTGTKTSVLSYYTAP
jgi:hypothetical protein